MFNFLICLYTIFYSETPYKRFFNLLPPADKTFLANNPGLVHTIERYYFSWMNGLNTQVGAVQLLKEANMRPTATTVVRIENKYNLVLNGNFEGGEMDASSGSVFVRAYDTTTLEPRILKFTETRQEAQFECNIYYHMHFESAVAAMRHRVVPVMQLVDDVDGNKCGVAMPTFISSINKVNLDRGLCPHLEAAMLKCVNDVLIAFSYIHEKQIYHNDVKSQNILINAAGECFLADFGSAFCSSVSREGKMVAFTDYYHPKDIASTVTSSSAGFDKLLLIVTVIDVLGYLTRDDSGSFSMSSLWKNITERVQDKVLKATLLKLWPTERTTV
jgi:hypothetical protein